MKRGMREAVRRAAGATVGEGFVVSACDVAKMCE
jgi:hypothetical protein